jgi:hypothetical protein
VWHLAAAYLAIVLAGAVFLFGRRETTLLRGERMFRLTAVFVMVALVSLAIPRVRPAPGVVAFWAASMACSTLIRKRWILFHYDLRTTAEVLEAAMTMLLIPFERAGPRYTLTIDERPAVVSVWRIVPRIALLTFAAHDGHKKMELFRALLAKRLRPVFPRPTIDLR